MPKFIQETLENIFKDKYPAFLDEANWSALIDLYQQCKSSDAHNFFSELEQLTFIPSNELQALFTEIEKELIEEARIVFNSKTTEIAKSAELFKIHVMASFPKFNSLGLTDLDWLKVIKLYQSMNKEKLSYTLLVHAISQITSKLYENLIDELKVKQQPLRRSKSIRRESQAPSSRPVKRLKFQEDTTPTTYVMDENTAPESLLTKGIKTRPLLPATPGKGGYRDPLQSPGGSVYHEIIKRHGLRLFDIATPEKQKAQIKDHHSPTHPAIKRYKQAKEIRFTVTKKTIDSCSSKRRIVSQKALTGISCMNVFIDYGDSNAKQLGGNAFHWSHLRAHFLGGQQSSKNIVPGTAISNFNTLRVVEKFIEKKLIDGTCSSIDVTVTPYFHGKSKIPSELVFTLSWNEPSLSHSEQQEIISINPRSFKSIKGSNLRTIEALRELQSGGGDEENAEPPAPKKLF